MYAIPAEGGSVPLCLHCKALYNRMMLDASVSAMRQYNFLMAAAESVTGILGVLPRYSIPEPRADVVFQGGNVQLNNINVNNSDVGVLNVGGSVEMIDSSVTILKSRPADAAAGDALARFTEAVLIDRSIDEPSKRSLTQMLSVLSEEATSAPEQRRGFAVKPILSEISRYVRVFQGLHDLWAVTKPLLITLFGVPDADV